MKKTLLIGSLLLVGILAGCGNSVMNNNSAHSGDQVTVHYTATFDDGAIFETTSGTDARTFTIGASSDTINGLENAVIGMEEGETKTVVIMPKEAYGDQYDPRKKQKVPAALFDSIDVDPQVGNFYAIGNVEGYVTAHDGDTVTIDVNPKHTRQDLTYEITVENIDKPTDSTDE